MRFTSSAGGWIGLGRCGGLARRQPGVGTAARRREARELVGVDGRGCRRKMQDPASLRPPQVEWRLWRWSAGALVGRAELPFGERGTCQALSGEGGIVAQGREQLRQPARVSGRGGHAVELCLQLDRLDGRAVELVQSSAHREGVLDLPLDRSSRHDLVERRLGTRVLPGPEAMAPIDLFKGRLAGNTIAEGERWRGCIRCRERKDHEGSESSEERDEGESPGTDDRSRLRRTEMYTRHSEALLFKDRYPSRQFFESEAIHFNPDRT